MSELKELQSRAVEIAEKYAELNARQGHKAWGPKERSMGFVADVGELMELVMAKEGLRHIDDVDTKLKHELADCLWSIVVMAKEYDIDLEKAFLTTMDQLEERIKNE